MKKSLKQAVIKGVVALLFTQAGQAFAATEGIEFSIRWDGTNSLYKVYMRPISTPSPDVSTTAQVTVRVPHAEIPDRFVVSSITPKHTGVIWANNSKVYAPTENANYDYLSFTANISDSRIFKWEAGVEQEVFSFANTGKCLGPVTLIVNKTDPFDIEKNSSGTNPGNEFSNLSWAADSSTLSAYVGNYGTAADCTTGAAVNTAPKAVDDSATVVSGSAVTIDVLANDTDAESDTLSIQSAADGGFGSVLVQGGKLVYTANEGIEDLVEDTFTYVVSDSTGGTNTGTVTVTITAKPSSTDTDGDGLSNAEEQDLGTDPAVVDTDLDGVPDKTEVGTDLTKPLDTDGDGKIDALDADDDNDGLLTSSENYNSGIPVDDDTDKDGKADYLDSDDDGDGKLSAAESNDPNKNNLPDDALDSDGDSKPDYLDLNDADGVNGDLDKDGLTNAQEQSFGSSPTDADSDDDGILDGQEFGTGTKARDTDGDGKLDMLDADDDNDGVPTATEDHNLDGDKNPSTNPLDTDADGTPNYLDNDDDGDTKLSASEDKNLDGDKNPATNPTDTDGDSMPDYLDASEVDGPNGDTDGDGLSNAEEQDLGTDPAVVDTDLDGVPDKTEVGTDLTKPLDTDGDGKIDALDVDDDNDGKLTKSEDDNTDGDDNPQTNPRDTDSDEIPDYLDANDTAPEAVADSAAVVSGSAVTIDVLANDTDAESDTLSIQSALDGDFGSVLIQEGKLVYTADEGIEDLVEDTFTYVVSDGKGGTSTGTVTVTITAKPSSTDTDGDGLSNAEEQDLGTDPAVVDTDLDGVPDKTEVGTDLTKPLDTDGDGKIDALDVDDDNDGKLTKSEDDNTDGDDNPQTNPRDTDSDEIPDYLDANDDSDANADDDGDGLSNIQEGKLRTNPRKMDTDGDSVPDDKEVGTDATKPADSDGDGVINALDVDDDNDGVLTTYENYKTAGVLNTDTDKDGIPDYLDVDDDNDGVMTSKEVADANKDGNPTDAVDTDSNGVPDYLDQRLTAISTQVSVPTLSQWSQMLLTLLLGMFAFRRFTKKS